MWVHWSARSATVWQHYGSSHRWAFYLQVHKVFLKWLNRLKIDYWLCVSSEWLGLGFIMLLRHGRMSSAEARDMTVASIITRWWDGNRAQLVSGRRCNVDTPTPWTSAHVIVSHGKGWKLACPPRCRVSTSVSQSCINTQSHLPSNECPLCPFPLATRARCWCALCPVWMRLKNMGK